MLPEFKIQEIISERFANSIHKQVHTTFVYKICKSRGKYFLYFKLNVY